MDEDNKPILVALGSSIVFVFWFIILDLGLVLSIFGTVVCGIGAWFLVPKKNKAEIEAETVETAIAAGYVKLRNIERLEKGMSAIHPRAKAYVQKIIVLIGKILQDLKDDPKDYAQARQFLTFYLDSTINIITKYMEISKHNVTDEKIKTSLLKVEEMLKTLSDAYEVQLTKLLQNEVMDLDIELDLLKQSIKTEGLEK